MGEDINHYLGEYYSDGIGASLSGVRSGQQHENGIVSAFV